MGKKRSVGKEKEKDKEKGKREIKELGSSARRFMPLVFFSFGALLTVLAYVRCLHAPLVFDDIIFITPSKLEGIWRHFTLRVRSISLFSFAVNYALSGINVAVFRMTNILLHLLTSGLVFYLTHLTVNLPLFREKYGKVPVFIPLAVAVFFMLHPIQTSAVNYITQRMAIMAGMFSFAGFIFYSRGVTTRGKMSVVHYILSALSFVLAIFSKENAVMVLFMLPVYDFFFLSSFQWREFRKRFITLSVLMLCLAGVVAYVMGIAGFMKKIITLLSNPNQPMEKYAWAGVGIHWTPIEYLLTELRVVSRYILLILVPLPSFMVFDYSNAYPVSKDLFHPLATVFSLLFLVSLVVFSLRNMKKTPLVSFGILWYLVTLSLESFIALGLDPYFEHRNYLPSFGLFLAIGSLFLYGEPRSGIKKEAIIASSVVILCILTFTRNGVWTTEERLWKDAIEKSPNNLRALISVSSVYIREERFQEAEEYLKRASAVKPITAQFRIDMLFNQASVYKETNRRKEALAILKGLEVEGAFPRKTMRSTVDYFIGEVLRQEGNLPQAKEYLERAYQGLGDTPEVLVSLGVVSGALGETDAAEGYFSNAVKKAPIKVMPYIELGDIYLMRNDIDKAEKSYGEAIRRGPETTDMQKRAIFGMAQVKLIKGETNEAKRLFNEVIRIVPGFYPPYIFLGRISLKENDPGSALPYLEKALSFKDTFMKNEANTKLLYLYLGRAYLGNGEKKLAKKNLSTFLSMAAGDKRLETQYTRAREEWARIKE
jgi:tetratricopeptide (TPR) repeat protein